MAVKIGTTFGAKDATSITLTQNTDEASAFSAEYGVGNYADNMKIAIDGNDTIYTVTGNASGTLSINPVLSDTVTSGTDVTKCTKVLMVPNLHISENVCWVTSKRSH